MSNSDGLRLAQRSPIFLKSLLYHFDYAAFKTSALVIPTFDLLGLTVYVLPLFSCSCARRAHPSSLCAADRPLVTSRPPSSTLRRPQFPSQPPSTRLPSDSSPQRKSRSPSSNTGTTKECLSLPITAPRDQESMSFGIAKTAWPLLEAPVSLSPPLQRQCGECVFITLPLCGFF